MERSRATLCPCAAYHLVGTKRVQQVLARPGVLERLVGGGCGLMGMCVCDGRVGMCDRRMGTVWWEWCVFDERVICVWWEVDICVDIVDVCV